MPPKSKEFHRLVREVLGPVLADLGFSRSRGGGLGGWVREQDRRSLVLRTQLGKWNYGEDPEGYTFTVELHLGKGGVRLYQVLTEQEQLEHVAIHNEVVPKTRPNPEYLKLLLASERAEHLATLQPRAAPFSVWDDPWFRYTDADDVRRWLQFIGCVLPGAIARFAAAVETPTQETLDWDAPPDSGSGAGGAESRVPRRPPDAPTEAGAGMKPPEQSDSPAG